MFCKFLQIIFKIKEREGQNQETNAMKSASTAENSAVLADFQEKPVEKG
jgi:hypothetical protein